MESRESQSTPTLSTKETLLCVTLLAIMSGCNTDTNKCLGERGEKKEEKIAQMVKDCDKATDKYVGTTNADITRNPGIDNERFLKASEACQLASKRSADLHKDVTDEAEITKDEKSFFITLGLKKSKKESCLKAIKWSSARNAEANADGRRLFK